MEGPVSQQPSAPESRRTAWARFHPRHAILALAVAVVGIACWHSPTAWLRWGLVLRACPEGQPVPKLHLSVQEIGRGHEGVVRIRAEAVFWDPLGERSATAPMRRFEQRLSLVDAEGNETPLEPLEGWTRLGAGRLRARLALPPVTDGDYRLRAEIDGPLGPTRAELPLALYAPAVVHLATDRPMYEPGHTIRFRAVTFRMADLTPMENRPGRFVVKDPSGQVLMDEAVPAGLYGVAASDLPLSDSAPVGDYEVAYHSGDAVDSVTARVEPFHLPRFSIDIRADRSWYTTGQAPRLEGTVRYRSGAPVRRARLQIQASLEQGEWPLPNAWREPRTLLTDDDGAFTLRLNAVPDDLYGEATASVAVVATDATGERIAGGTTLRLSADPISVRAETEMGDGLVPDLNNRLYLRVTRPNGVPLSDVDLRVSRAWEPADEGVTARTDRDAVAALQLDPGQPISIVRAPPPFRPPLPSTLLASYRPEEGFGPGLTGLLVLDALTTLFDQPLPESIRITLCLDGTRVVEQRLDLAAGFTPALARHPLPPGENTHSVRIVAEPALPGLGFTLRATHWLPPDPDAGPRGFTLRVEGPEHGRIGEPATVQLAASPPGGERLDLLLALPAGVEPEPASLDDLQQSGTIESWEHSQGKLVLQLPSQADGASFRASLRVIPTLAGYFHWGRATLSLADDPALFTEANPSPWEVDG